MNVHGSVAWTSLMPLLLLLNVMINWRLETHWFLLLDCPLIWAIISFILYLKDFLWLIWVNFLFSLLFLTSITSSKEAIERRTFSPLLGIIISRFIQNLNGFRNLLIIQAKLLLDKLIFIWQYLILLI